MWSYNQTSALDTYTTFSTSRSNSQVITASGASTSSTSSSDGNTTLSTRSAVAATTAASNAVVDFTLLGGDFTHTRSSAIGTTTQTSTLSVDNSIESRSRVSFSATNAASFSHNTGGTPTSGSSTAITSFHQEFYGSPSLNSSSGSTVLLSTRSDGSTFLTSSTSTSRRSTSGNTQTQSSASGGTTADSAGTTVATASFSTTATLVHTSTYNSTTLTSTQAITATLTTTSTRSSTYPESGTTTGTTSSASSSDTFTSTSSASSVSTITSYQTQSYAFPIKKNTIVIADNFTDWPWLVTTTGTSLVSAIGNSFTQTTFTNAGSAGSVALTSVTVTQTVIPYAQSTVTQTIPSFGSTSTTSTTGATSSSTYNIAGPASTVASLSYSNTTRTATISHTTSVSTAFTFTSTTTQNFSFTISSISESTATTTASSSFRSTNAGGAITTTVTYSSIRFANTLLVTVNTNQTEALTFSASEDLGGWTTFVSIEGASSTGGTAGVGATSFTGTRTFSEHLQSSAATPTRTEITLGEGYQVWPSVGRGQPIGTNISAAFSLVIPRADGAFGTTVRTPVLYGGTTEVSVAGLSMTTRWETSDSRAYITYDTGGGTATATASLQTLGVVPVTLRNTRASTLFGGWGWDSTASTSFTNSSGLHRATIVDATSWTTTDLAWAAATSFQIAPGQAIALQMVPLVASQASTTAHNPYLNWPRHPVS